MVLATAPDFDEDSLLLLPIFEFDKHLFGVEILAGVPLTEASLVSKLVSKRIMTATCELSLVKIVFILVRCQSFKCLWSLTSFYLTLVEFSIELWHGAGRLLIIILGLVILTLLSLGILSEVQSFDL